MLLAVELLLRGCAPVEWRAIPGLTYELVPGLDQQSHAARVVTDSEGLRDRERTRVKPPGTRRIAVLGDSFAFGYGVEGDAAWPAVLERLLPPGDEVLDSGVGGHSTQDEAALREHKALGRGQPGEVPARLSRDLGHRASRSSPPAPARTECRAGRGARIGSPPSTRK